MLRRVKARALKASLPFNITEDDFEIPDACPILGVQLKANIGGSSGTPQSPSLDRIVPELGYTKGNVVVISNRANMIKSNATPQELEAVARWLRRRLNPSTNGDM